MAMVLVTNGLVAVVHILAGIDVEILLLIVLNVEHISLDLVMILSEICTQSWSIETR